MNPKVVVITGASSGIGAALARNLGSKGHSLVLGARREEMLRKVADEAGARTVAVVTDVTRREDHERLRDAAIKEFRRVDVWVNNAGRGTGKTVMELTDEEFQSVLDVVLKSVLYGMQTIVPHFIERGEGHLINVSSFLGRVPLISFRSVYCAAKSGVNMLGASLRMDLRSKYPGIHVSTVMPGIVDTEFHKVVGTPMRFEPGQRVGPLVVETADDVAAQIASLIDHPVPELYTGPSMASLAQDYYRDVGAFETRMGQR